MKKLHLLFLDLRISQSKTAKVLSDKFNLYEIEVGKKMIDLISRETELGKKIKSIMDSGEIIPEYLIKDFLKYILEETKNQNILLIQFPRNIEQYKILEIVLKELDIEIETVWYVKQKNPEQYFENFKNPKEKIWLEKYGDEVIENWKKNFESLRESITLIQKETSFLNWKIIEMDYVSDISEEYILNKINDCV